VTTTTFLESLNETIPIEKQTLMLNFLMIFSRFEYALKASGFSSNSVGRVTANWDTFIASIKGKFDKNNNDQLRKAVDSIIQNPPKIQTVKNRQLDWKERDFSPNDREINRLCLSIRDIRNNFFHGSKFNRNYDRPRNYNLLNHAIIIMNAWIDLNDTVKRKFLEPI
jgi:hypothetical protein